MPILFQQLGPLSKRKHFLMFKKSSLTGLKKLTIQQIETEVDRKALMGFLAKTG